MAHVYTLVALTLSISGGAQRRLLHAVVGPHDASA